MAVQLEAIYTKQEDIPEAFRELFTEKGGKWELTAVKGVKTQADVDRLQKSLHEAQADNKTLKAAAKVWEPFGKAEELQAKLDRIEELEVLAKGKGDDTKIEELVTKRLEANLKTKTGPLERQLKQLGDELAAVKNENSTLKAERTQRAIRDEIRTAATAKDVGLRNEAIDDALLLGERVFELTADGKVLTRDNVGVTPGIDPKQWLQDMREKRTHWWPETVGGGSRGTGRGGVPTGADNPWSAEGWNMTKQGAYLREHGAEKAAKLAEAAGTKVGGLRPKPKAAAK